ncbi:MAG TPA: type II 3-dehydroquinate dehydratase [Alphaproteobacteria bacterium]|nr:type II 3-dehydroquinate dehydratase [Rhodospirillaceae bacterium]HRJ12413.1 type II 3-dehydroquinate dehydratase [Alphaproteobacteria bacterium]
MKPIYILNGPNLNMLGQRDPAIYGSDTLKDIEAMCRARAAELGATIEFRQSNHEGVLIDWVQEAREKAAAIIINPGGYSHTSIALMDALEIAGIPVIEVHLSNIHAREAFRQHSYVSRVATEVIMGHKSKGYVMAVEAAVKLALPAKSA